MVREILLHPAKPMAWIRGGSRQGLEEFYYILLNLWLGSIAVWIRDCHVAMLLHASRFAEMLGMGMSQAAILLHSSHFAEMIDMGISQAAMRLHASRFTEMLDIGMSQAAMVLHVSRFAEMLDMRMSQAEMLIVCTGVPS